MSIIHEFLKRPIAYNPIVAKAFGSVKLGILWSQLYYWSDKTKDQNGWVYKTQKDIYEETGLSRKEQETARRIGRELGVLEEKIAGQPAKVHYKINFEKAIQIISEFRQEPIKEKQIKFKSTNSIDFARNLPEEEAKELAGKYSVSLKFVKDRAEDVVDYCEASGKRYKNYKATIRNFIKSEIKKNPDAIIRKKTFIPKQQFENKQRTPEEQAQINKRIEEIRQGKLKLANKLNANN